MSNVLDLGPRAKALRARVIRQYMEANGFDKCVCFSCGNASRALKGAGVLCVDISKSGDMVANRWWTKAEISRIFPTCFDATSGHLPIELMVQIAEEMRRCWEYMFVPGNYYNIATGSGETIFCLAIAFPCCHFTAVYDNSNPATEWCEHAPMNEIIEAFFETEKRN